MPLLFLVVLITCNSDYKNIFHPSLEFSVGYHCGCVPCAEPIADCMVRTVVHSLPRFNASTLILCTIGMNLFFHAGTIITKIMEWSCSFAHCTIH